MRYMKRTEIERIEREARRVQKRAEMTNRRKENDGLSVGAYIDLLFQKLRYDQEEVFNTQNDEKVLEILEDIRNNLPEKKWDDVVRKAIKKTGVTQREKAVTELKELMQ